MGLDKQSLKFLKFCATKNQFGRTVTIGRQNCYASLRDLSLSGWKHEYIPEFIEKILVDCFGADNDVASIDNSNYEGATIIGDLNKQIVKPIRKYDTVIDLGSMEHIYNVPNAIDNIRQFCNVGSRIIHVLPANGFCGHGLYQFSPELFFAIYSDKNGFSDTCVYIKKLDRNNKYYKVKKPEGGLRRLVYTKDPTYVCVSTTIKNISQVIDVQQSDFEYQWQGHAKPQKLSLLSQFLERYTLRSRSMWNDPLLGWVYRLYVMRKYSVSNHNPNLELHYLN